MFNRNVSPEDAGLQEVINSHVERMTNVSTHENYQKMMNQYIQLMTLRKQNAPKPLSKDTLAIVAGNFAGILTIVLAEKSSVITSVARNFILKAH